MRSMVSIFVNEQLNEALNFLPYPIERLYKYAEIDGEELEQVTYLFSIMKQLPASVKGYHGNYKGGLYDHTILTANIAVYFYRSIEFAHLKEILQRGTLESTYRDIHLEDVVKACLYHDLGKIPYYCKVEEVPIKYKLEKSDCDPIREELIEKHGVGGRDLHVEGAILMIRTFKLKINWEVERAIVLHHGGWGKYTPQKSSRLSVLIHSADLLASKLIGV